MTRHRSRRAAKAATIMLGALVLAGDVAHASSEFDVPSSYGLEFPSILRGGEFSYLFDLLKRECGFKIEKDTTHALRILRTMNKAEFTSGFEGARKIYQPMLKELGKKTFCQKAYTAYGPQGQGNVRR